MCFTSLLSSLISLLMCLKMKLEAPYLMLLSVSDYAYTQSVGGYGSSACCQNHSAQSAKSVTRSILIYGPKGASVSVFRWCQIPIPHIVRKRRLLSLFLCALAFFFFPCSPFNITSAFYRCLQSVEISPLFPSDLKTEREKKQGRKRKLYI